MIKNSIEKLAEPIGFDIGMSDNIVQANLLNGLCKGLASHGSGNQLGVQLCYIVDELNSNSYNVIKELAEFIKIREGKNAD